MELVCRELASNDLAEPNFTSAEEPLQVADCQSAAMSRRQLRLHTSQPCRLGSRAPVLPSAPVSAPVLLSDPVLLLGPGGTTFEGSDAT